MTTTTTKTPKPLTANAVGELLNASTCSRSKGVYTARWSFFYRMNGTAEGKCNRVLAVFPHAHVVDSGEVWKAFRGGASVANQSHWFVKFTLDGTSVLAE
jgi:hypothetical protein